MNEIEIHIVRLPHGRDLPLPQYESAFAAGMDLRAAIETELVLIPGARALVPTGIAIALPPGYEAQVRPRSGLALKHGITGLNSPGTVDADYRGEIQVLLVNHGTTPFTVERGMFLKRFQARAKGRGNRVLKHTCHIYITVGD